MLQYSNYLFINSLMVGLLDFYRLMSAAAEVTVTV